MSEQQQYLKGFGEGIADIALLRNNCNKNGYTFAEYLRIKDKLSEIDFLQKFKQADVYQNGYMDGADTEAIKINIERGEPDKNENIAAFSKYYHLYAHLFCNKLIKKEASK